jgi:hypothetical protein
MNLPDLPFPYGDAVCDSMHSTVRAVPHTYPRTNLNSLTHWDSFPDEIHNAIRSATTRKSLTCAAFNVSGWTDPEDLVVTNEETIRAHAAYALHIPVQNVARKLGIQGKFVSPGSGNSSVIGAPDFSWVMSGGQPHPKLIVSTVSASTVLLLTQSVD